MQISSFRRCSTQATKRSTEGQAQKKIFLLTKMRVIVKIGHINTNFSRPFETDYGKQTLDERRTHSCLKSLPEVAVRQNAFTDTGDHQIGRNYKPFGQRSC